MGASFEILVQVAVDHIGEIYHELVHLHNIPSANDRQQAASFKFCTCSTVLPSVMYIVLLFIDMILS